MNIDTMIVRLLNLCIEFEELDLLPEIKNVIRPKFKIMRDMRIEANNLLNEIDENKNNKFETSRKISSFYKRFKLVLIHQTYSLTMKDQRKIVLIPTRQKFRIFFNTKKMDKFDEIKALSYPYE